MTKRRARRRRRRRMERRRRRASYILDSRQYGSTSRMHISRHPFLSGDSRSIRFEEKMTDEPFGASFLPIPGIYLFVTSSLSPVITLHNLKRPPLKIWGAGFSCFIGLHLIHLVHDTNASIWVTMTPSFCCSKLGLQISLMFSILY